MKSTFYIQWHITNFCNLRCQHCYQDDFSNRKDLDWSGLKKVADQIAKAMKEWKQKACIHLTGGEPLLKPELYPLLEYLNERDEVDEVGMITNGLCIDSEVIRRLSAYAKLKKIKISLDGAVPATNDSIRSPGTFSRVMQNLSLLQEEGRWEVLMMFTAMKRNFQEIPSFIRLCRNLDVQGLIIERFIPWGRGKKNKTDVLDKNQWQQLIEMLLRYFSLEIEGDDIFSYQAFQVDFQREEPELLGAPCVLGEEGLCIMPDGEVFPCRRFPISIGNLLDDSLDQIWKGAELLKLLRHKENLQGKCRDCALVRCRGCRSLALACAGDFLAEDPHCGYVSSERSTSVGNKE
jgi:radical SAM protein with 4Fe4S-binding SPASM domain